MLVPQATLNLNSTGAVSQNTVRVDGTMNTGATNAITGTTNLTIAGSGQGFITQLRTIPAQPLFHSKDRIMAAP